MNKILQKTQRNYLRSHIEKNNSTKKDFWDCVNKMCGKTKSKTKIEKIQNQEGEIITDIFLVTLEKSG